MSVSVIVLCAAACALFIRVTIKRAVAWWTDSLWEFEPVTDDEALLLTTVDETYYADVLRYVRSMQMSIRLQDYLKDNKDALESIQIFMLLQVANRDSEKKEQWEKERGHSPRKQGLTHIEKMILQRLGK